MSYYVYLIQQHGPQTCTKIGITGLPAGRLSNLQVANPYRLTLRYEHECKNATAAAALEYALHRRFEGKRLSGEWFACSADYILDHATDLFHIVRNPPPVEPIRAPAQAPKAQPVATSPHTVDELYALTLVLLIGAVWLTIGYIMLQVVWSAPSGVALTMITWWAGLGGIVFAILAFMHFIQDVRDGVFDPFLLPFKRPRLDA